MEGREPEFEYLRKAILFFETYKWVYFLPVTKILFNGSMNFFPDDWLKILLQFDNCELNNFVAKSKVQVCY